MVIATTTGGGKSATPAAAVKGYLEALARGDADAALSYSSDQPASKEFLTDDVLKKQIDKWPISDIRILDDTATASMGTVHVAVKFGDQTSDETLFLEQKDDISDKGRSATDQALRDFLSNCAKSNRLAPPNCPQKTNEPGLVDGTVVWTAPSDISGVTLGFLDPKTLSTRLFGSVKYGISVKTVEGGTKTGIATVYLSGTADLTSSPPKISI